MPLRETVRSAQPMPAQLTAVRNGGAAVAARSTAACTDDSSATSVRANSPFISSAIRWPAASFRSAITTVAPAAASTRAVASPRPLAPPETIAEVPFKFMPGAYPARCITSQLRKSQKLRRYRKSHRPQHRQRRTR